jgi:hypothetical protein
MPRGEDNERPKIGLQISYWFDGFCGRRIQQNHEKVPMSIVEHQQNLLFHRTTNF